MGNTKQKQPSTLSKSLLMGIFLLLASAAPANIPKVPKPFLAPQTKREIINKADSVSIEVKVQSPASQETPLQIVCLFEYSEGDIFKSTPALPKELNGLVNVDEALSGLITELRKTHRFEGKTLETLLIIPPKNTVSARRLLLIGLGSKDQFEPETMRWVGMVGMREALRLGVASYSHASDLKDAGISSPTAEVAGYVIQGALEAYQTQKYLQGHNASDPLTVTKITLLSDSAYFEESKEGIKKAIAGFSKDK